MAQLDWIALYLEEDLGTIGDVTSDSIFPAAAEGSANLVAREPCFLAGVARATDVFERLGAKTTTHMNDGSWIDGGAAILTVSGPTRAVLAGERLALNMIGRMSGVATETRHLVEQLGKACSGAVVACTRKTTPGFRQFEKEAVTIAGGEPHRAGLWDAAMIKDNHREAAGDIAAAVKAVAAEHPELIITAEVESLADARAAAAAGAHWLLIDNQTPETGESWAKEIWQEFPEIKIEASGGIQPANIESYGWADRISLGAITNRARTMDFSLEWVK